MQTFCLFTVFLLTALLASSLSGILGIEEEDAAKIVNGSTSATAGGDGNTRASDLRESPPSPSSGTSISSSFSSSSDSFCTANCAAQRVDPLEYELFLESMYGTQKARERYFQRIGHVKKSSIPDQPSTGQPNSGQPNSGHLTSDQPNPAQPATGQPNSGHLTFGQPNPAQPATGQPVSHRPSFELTLRKYNFSSHVQFEEEFDCDLTHLTRCESTLLQKVALIISNLSQEEVLAICQSVDDEFKNCLLRYAEKCEQKMSLDAFVVLKHIIVSNNDTIMTCHDKELDWLGSDMGLEGEGDLPDGGWIDRNHVVHYLNKSTFHAEPCIEPSSIAACIVEHFGQEFDLARHSIRTPDHCDSLIRADRCFKKLIFEEDSTLQHKCNMEEKETSLDIVRAMFHFDLEPANELVLVHCHATRDNWAKSDAGVEEQKMRDQDAATRYTETMKNAFNMIKPMDCYEKTLVDDELCFDQFETRIRKLWKGQGVDNFVTWEDEIDAVCCTTALLSKCMGTFVLIRCGVDVFAPYQDQLEFMRFNTGPQQCATLTYECDKCQSILYGD